MQACAPLHPGPVKSTLPGKPAPDGGRSPAQPVWNRDIDWTTGVARTCEQMSKPLPAPPRRTFLSAGAATVALASTMRAPANPGPARIKIGQIGTSHPHALGKLDTILKYPQLFELVGIVENDQKRRQTIAQRYPNLRWLPEAELLQSPGLQAIAVETSVDELAPTGLRCLQAGMHIHLDKPAGPTLEDCRKLHEEATRRRLIVQMGYMFRYNPAFEFLFKAVRDGWLGEITEINGMIGKKINDSGRQNLARYEGGGTFELACHLIDAMVTVLGRPTRIQGINHQTFPGKDTFADNQLSIFDYPKAIATIRCNHIDPLGWARRCFSVTGTLGTCEIRPLEPPTLRLGLDRDRAPYKRGYQDVKLPEAAGRYDGEFIDLARVIRGEKTLAWDATHDLAVHEAVLRASGMIT